MSRRWRMEDAFCIGHLDDEVLETQDFPSDTSPVEDEMLIHRAQLRSQPLISMSTETFKVTYRSALTKPESAVKHTSPSVLGLSIIPKACRRTLGLTANFTFFETNSNSPRISPTVHTFNVVPQDSAIINYVARDDLQNVRRMFEAGTASPFDIEPGGFSLLSVCRLLYSLRIKTLIWTIVCDSEWVLRNVPLARTRRSKSAEL